jgi:hypothetical protein
MPNLLPDWTQTLPLDLGEINLRAAGRLIWSLLFLIVGIAFVVALIKPPLLKRPFPLKAGIALFPVIIVVGLLFARFIPSLQRSIIWVMLAAIVGHAFLMVVSRTPRDPARQTTWVEAFAGATAVFALFAIGYAILPHEWLTFANSELEWGDSSRFIFKSTEDMLFLPWHWPINFDFPALRDIVVTMIYGVILVTNLKLWVMWQKRLEVKPEAEPGLEPERRSRFGRPLRRTRETAGAGAVPEGA